MRIILRGATVMPLDGRRALKKSDVMIEDGVIAAAGGNVDTEDAEIVELEGVLMPGLVNAHTHLEQALLDRHFVPHLDPGVFQNVQLAALRTHLDREAVELMAHVALAEGLLAGTTSTADAGTGGHRASAIRIAQRLGARLVLGIDAADDAANQIDLLSESVGAESNAFVSPALWCGDAERVRRRFLADGAFIANQKRVAMFVHAGMMPNDRIGVRRLSRVEALGERLVICHANGLSISAPRDLEAITNAKASVVLTPGFDVLSGAPPPPLDQLLEGHVNLALGVESGATRMGYNLFREVRLLRRLLVGRTEGPASRALEIATRGGSQALHLNVGSIEVGHRADLVLVDVKPEYGEGHEEVARRIVDHGGPDLVRSVWVDGRTVVHNGRLLNGTTPSADAREQVRARLGFKVEQRQRSALSKPQALLDWLGRRRRHRAGWHAGRLPFGR